MDGGHWRPEEGKLLRDGGAWRWHAARDLWGGPERPEGGGPWNLLEGDGELGSEGGCPAHPSSLPRDWGVVGCCPLPCYLQRVTFT